MRVQNAVQASLTLEDASSGNTILIDSANYGTLDNNISVSIAAGTLQGTKVTVSYNASTVAPAIPSNTVVMDNILRQEFSIQYIGAAVTKPTLTINETELETTGSSNAADNFSLAFSTYTTIQSIINYITATYPSTFTVVSLTPNPGDPTAASLDHVTTQAIATAFTVTANVQQIVNTINAQASALITAERYPTSPSGLLPANGSFYLTGGLDISDTAHLDGSTATPLGVLSDVHDWGYAITLMAAQPVDLEVVLSGDTTNWASLSNSVTTTSVNAENVRRAFVGTNSGQSESTISTVLGDIITYLNNSRVACAMQGVYDNDYITGAYTFYPGYIVAAQLAGLQAGQAVGSSITYLQMAGKALEWNPTTTDMTNLISGGVIPLQYLITRGYIRVVRGISTWLVNNNFYDVEFATGIALDTIVKDIQEALEVYIGQPVSPNTAYQIGSTVDSVLTDEVNAGLAVGNAASPPYSNIVVTANGDTFSVSFTVSVVIPTNYINVSISATSFSGTLTVAVSPST